MPQNATTDKLIAEIRRLQGALALIANLPIELNTVARAIAQESISFCRVVPYQHTGPWRSPLTVEQIEKTLRRGGYHGEITIIKPREGEQAMETEGSSQDQPEQIEMIPVVSSNVDSVGHNGADVLRVAYKNGGVYEWRGIAPGEFIDLVRSESPGRTLRELTANRGIKGMKVGGDPA